MTGASLYPLYNNLSCPFEWSKYSCAHQRLPGAELSRQFALEHLEQIRGAAAALASANGTRVWLIGDSLVRQIFIAIACAGAATLVRSHVNWSKYWPCGSTPKADCVVRGVHSGFDIGSAVWPGGFELQYTPIAGSPHFSEPGIIHRLAQEASEGGAPSFGNADAPPGQPRSTSRAGDVIVVNSGIHKPSSKGVLERVVELRRRLGGGGARVLYLTTPTQHYNTSRGQFDADADAGGACVPRVASNPRAELERAILRPGNVSLLEYDDLDLGALHIGRGNDCSHYCMPGKPDEVAARLVDAVLRPGHART